MIAMKTAVTVTFVIALAAATIWLAFQVGGTSMPVWMAAAGPVMGALALWLHWRNRQG